MKASTAKGKPSNYGDGQQFGAFIWWEPGSDPDDPTQGTWKVRVSGPVPQGWNTQYKIAVIATGEGASFESKTAYKLENSEDVLTENGEGTKIRLSGTVADQSDGFDFTVNDSTTSIQVRVRDESEEQPFEMSNIYVGSGAANPAKLPFWIGLSAN